VVAGFLVGHLRCKLGEAMKITEQNKFALALHDVPMCAVCNKRVDRMESEYDINTYQKRFRVYCHGQTEDAFLSDMDIWDADSIRMGQAFIDKLPQPQLEMK
jgi:hypothetical protein